MRDLEVVIYCVHILFHHLWPQRAKASAWVYLPYLINGILDIVTVNTHCGFVFLQYLCMYVYGEKMERKWASHPRDDFARWGHIYWWTFRNGTSDPIEYSSYGFFIRTGNGPTDAPFSLSTCDLLQVVASALKFRLIYDAWYFIYTKSSKREDLKSCDFRRFLYEKLKSAFRNCIRFSLLKLT